MVFHALVGIVRFSHSSRITFIETVAYPLDLLAQYVPQHRDARVGRREVFEGMHGDRSLAFLRLEIIWLALTLFVSPR
jgi:hypothetical protein